MLGNIIVFFAVSFAFASAVLTAGQSDLLALGLNEHLHHFLVILSAQATITVGTIAAFFKVILPGRKEE